MQNCQIACLYTQVFNQNYQFFSDSLVRNTCTCIIINSYTILNVGQYIFSQTYLTVSETSLLFFLGFN